jgi:hypothetical protein
MASAEYEIESVIIAKLAASGTFTGIDIEHWTEDESTVTKANRLTVKVDPKTPAVPPYNPIATVPVWRSTITVSAQHNGTDTTFDAWREAVDSVVKNGVGDVIKICPPDGGGIFDGPTKRRTLTRTFPVVFRVS